MKIHDEGELRRALQEMDGKPPPNRESRVESRRRRAAAPAPARVALVLGLAALLVVACVAAIDFALAEPMKAIAACAVVWSLLSVVPAALGRLFALLHPQE